MTGWAGRFEAELMRLGLQPARARQLTEETSQQAAECATEPDHLFGPAHLYARHLLTELSRTDPDPPPTTGRVLLGPPGSASDTAAAPSWPAST